MLLISLLDEVKTPGLQLHGRYIDSGAKSMICLHETKGVTVIIRTVCNIVSLLYLQVEI